ncbi:MAG TPA: hydroxymethylbilane synthase [Armatimonadota bacterium]|nr:hydroxymethylbilane synthase [Armatimonadota bacterium]
MMRLGTRGSKLALAQSRRVAEALGRLGAEVTLATITTSGDRAVMTPPAPNATGLFVKELETALRERRIDLAVHSLKDLTTVLPPGLILGAVLPRDSALDALVCRERGRRLDDLPRRARVGTSSPRRRAQLLHYRSDLQVSPLRGNVDTRLRRLDGGAFDAIVLARAGLTRLGLEQAQPWDIPPEICLPAPGQGALVVEIRDDDAPTAMLVAALDDPPTRACVTAERRFLQALGGGCHAAVGALARSEGDMILLTGAVASPDGRELLRASTQGALTAAVELGESLARELQGRGADALIEAAA